MLSFYFLSLTSSIILYFDSLILLERMKISEVALAILFQDVFDISFCSLWWSKITLEWDREIVGSVEEMGIQGNVCFILLSRSFGWTFMFLPLTKALSLLIVFHPRKPKRRTNIEYVDSTAHILSRNSSGLVHRRLCF